MQIQSLTGVIKPISSESRDLALSERARLAFKKGGAFLAAAVVSVFVPVLHFFLVPVFLLLSLYFAAKNFRYLRSVNLEGVCCPVCDKNLNEKKLFYREDEVRLYCYSCQTQLKIS